MALIRKEVYNGIDPNPISVIEREETAQEKIDRISKRIKLLEGKQTHRRIREAILGTDNGWLADLDQQIQQLRNQL